jgi:hypothetical protein
MKDFIFRVVNKEENKGYDFSLKEYMSSNEQTQNYLAPTDLLDTLELVKIMEKEEDKDYLTETEKVMAKIISDWFMFYIRRFDTSKIGDSKLFFNIVKEISAKFTCIQKELDN